MSTYCTACSRSRKCWEHREGSTSRGKASTSESGERGESKGSVGRDPRSAEAVERKRRQMEALERLEEIQRRLGQPSPSVDTASMDNRYISPPSPRVPAAVPVGSQQVRFNPVNSVREPTASQSPNSSGDEAAKRGKVTLMADRGRRGNAVDDLLFSPTPSAPPRGDGDVTQRSSSHTYVASTRGSIAVPTFPHDTSVYRAVESVELLREGFFSLTEAVKEDIAALRSEQRDAVTRTVREAMQEYFSERNGGDQTQRYAAAPAATAPAPVIYQPHPANHHLNNSKTVDSKHHAAKGAFSAYISHRTTDISSTFAADLRRRLGFINDSATEDGSDGDHRPRSSRAKASPRTSSSSTRLLSSSKRTLRILLGEAEGDEADASAMGRWGTTTAEVGGTGVSLEQFNRFRSAVRGAIVAELESKDQQIASLNRKVASLADAVELMKASGSGTQVGTHGSHLVPSQQANHLCEEVVVARVLAQLQPSIEHIRTSTKNHMNIQRTMIEDAVGRAVEEHLASPAFSRRRNEDLSQIDANLKQLRSDIRIAFKGVCSSVGCLQPAI